MRFALTLAVLATLGCQGRTEVDPETPFVLCLETAADLCASRKAACADDTAEQSNMLRCRVDSTQCQTEMENALGCDTATSVAGDVGACAAATQRCEHGPPPPACDGVFE